MQGFNFPTKGNSIVLLEQFNCSIEDKNDYTKWGHKKILQKKRKSKLVTVGFTLPVITNVMAGKGACSSVNATAAAHKKKPTVRL